MATDMPIRIGVMGCAEIARKVSRAIHLAPNAVIAAVASRSLEKAKLFASSNGYPQSAKIHGSYESILEDQEVDALYVPLPTSLHVEWAIRAAENGKHILLEKPVAMNVAEFDKIVAACEANGVQFMDGTMWAHHPRTAKLKEFLSDSDRFGQLKNIHCCFSFAADEDFLKNDIRVKPSLDGLGALGDAGWYAIRATLLANNFELPKTVTASPGAILNESGVILSCGASLSWENGQTATIYCSFLANLTMEITAIGTKGTLRVHDFVIPFQESGASFTTSTKSWFNDSVTAWVNPPSEHMVKTELPQEACMVREFARLVGEIKNNGAKPNGFWPNISRKTQLVVDAVKESLDKNYEQISLSGH
ncbi:putative oxidoreductase [Cardamine amara subsp. amara]|uniref:Oxidoreductase n=1 Tax=Cardamine amara subsp. amara TaxID=228776 RepID=A0ABD1BRW7_CARAN